MVLQVLTLMPIRTIMNYQYRYGTSTTQAARTLYADGGWPRYYQGLTAALIQGPLSRFGDTAANAGIMALLSSNTYMRKLPSFIKTIFASLAAAAFRMILTPVDTIKTTMQTDGQAGLKILRQRVSMFAFPSSCLWLSMMSGEKIWYWNIVVRRNCNGRGDVRGELSRKSGTNLQLVRISASDLKRSVHLSPSLLLPL